MIGNDQLHTMPIKFSQVLQQALDRGGEVVRGLDNDRIDLAKGNGTNDRSQPARKLRFHSPNSGGTDGDQPVASVAKRNPLSITPFTGDP